MSTSPKGHLIVGTKKQRLLNLQVPSTYKYLVICTNKQYFKNIPECSFLIRVKKVAEAKIIPIT